MSSESLYFYRDLKAVNSLGDIFFSEAFSPVPDDWWLVITDVTDSTKAIEKGLYKEVNISGALATIAIANSLSSLDYPFVFGGDGSTFLVPGLYKDVVRDILADTVRAVYEYYGLNLRAGLVSVKTLKDNSYKLLCAKLRVSNRYDQAFLAGDAVGCAENWIKCGMEEYAELIDDKHLSKTTADFTGFHCRWEDIKSQRGKTTSLIVNVLDSDFTNQSVVINEVINKINEIYGQESRYRPLSEENLRLSYSIKSLEREALVRCGGKKGLKFYFWLFRMMAEAFIGNIVVRYKIPLRLKGYELQRLAEYQVTSSDCKKYDGTLKMVLAGNEEELEKLLAYLEVLRTAGTINYGFFSSDRAIMTCLVHDDSGREVHFIDTADGGYAMAAKMIKEQACQR